MAQEEQIGEAVREEPPLAAPPRCLMQNTHSSCCLLCEGSCRVDHGEHPYLHLPEMINMGCLSSSSVQWGSQSCLWHGAGQAGEVPLHP